MTRETPKKPTGQKKTAGQKKTPASKKKVVKKKTAAAKPKASGAKTAKTSRAAPKKPAKRSSKAKSAKTATRRKPSIKALLAKRFEPWRPPELYTPPKTATPAAGREAPPLVSATDPDEAARIRRLLFKKFDSGAAGPAPRSAGGPGEESEGDGRAMGAFEPPTGDLEAPDGMTRPLKYLAAVLAVLILLVVGASKRNYNKYYLKPGEGAVEIWRGTFAPMGAERLLILPGMQVPGDIQAEYQKEEVFPYVARFYIAKADALLDVPGLPDFDGIKANLHKALEYAVTPALRNNIDNRLNSIETMVLVYKADIAASRDTVDGLQGALNYLRAAAALNRSGIESRHIQGKIEAVRARIAELKAQAGGETPD